MLDHATPFADWLIVAPVILGLAGGALLLVLRRFIALQPWLCLAFLIAILFCDAVLVERVLTSGAFSMTMGKWLPPFGIEFRADAMGAGFALAAAFVAFAVTATLVASAPESAVRDGLYPLILLLMAGVSGAFLTGDLFNLYVWFEVLLIASFGLIVLAGHPLQLDAAVKYGLLNVLATTLFLVALGLLYGQLGTLNMADLARVARAADPNTLAATAALFALAFGIKAAVFPVNAWLPAAYHAPPPAISALMGGILTKVGVYALIRLFAFVLPEARDVLSPVITAVAIATMLLGPLSAIAETNLRRAVGFLLIGGVGVALLAVPSGNPAALYGAVVYVAQSILSFAVLYLVAGRIEQVTGETDTRNMGGLNVASPFTGALFLVLVLGVAGVPPFLGFWPKLILLQGFIAAGDWLSVFTLLGNSLLALFAGARLWSFIFWRPRDGATHRWARHEPTTPLWVAIVVLLGLFPNAMLVRLQPTPGAAAVITAPPTVAPPS